MNETVDFHLFKKQYPDFDWNFYLSLYKDLFEVFNTEEEAIIHYFNYGKFEGRIYNKSYLDNNKKHISLLLNNFYEEQRNIVCNEFVNFTFLIRSNKRPKFFERCYNSIYEQNYPRDKIEINVSFHNQETFNYLKNYHYINLIKLKEVDVKKNTNNRYPFNYYLNDLLRFVKDDSWIIIIDDDDFLSNEYSLSTINSEILKTIKSIKNKNFSLYWRVARCDKLVGQDCFDLKVINDDTALCGFCFNSNLKEKIEFNANRVSFSIKKFSETNDVYWTKYIITKIGQDDDLAGYGFAENETFIESFYRMYPEFNWKFYLNSYEDLNKVFKTEEEAVNHYWSNGRFENRVYKKNIKKSIDYDDINYSKLEEIIKQNNITQLKTSESLFLFKDRFKKKYDLCEYFQHNKPAIFFGLYNDQDLQNLNNHKDKKFLMFGGSDINSFENIVEKKEFLNNTKDLNILSISKDIQDRLNSIGMNSVLVEFNLVDKDLFKKVDKLGNKIYIYNGYKKGNESIYGKEIYEQIIKELPKFEFIFSNDLQLSHENMPEIYSQCFLGLRLTDYDGNANTVQEFESMGIPIFHNFSKYGLKWETKNDIIEFIKKTKNTFFHMGR